MIFTEDNLLVTTLYILILLPMAIVYALFDIARTEFTYRVINPIKRYIHDLCPYCSGKQWNIAKLTAHIRIYNKSINERYDTPLGIVRVNEPYIGNGELFRR